MIHYLDASKGLTTGRLTDRCRAFVLRGLVSRRINQPLLGRLLDAIGEALALTKPLQLLVSQKIAHGERGLESSDPKASLGKCFFAWSEPTRYHYPRLVAEMRLAREGALICVA